MRLLPVAVLVVAACGSTMVRRPTDKQVDDAYTAAWLEEVRRVARSGDILLGRGYANVSDLIDVLTSGLEVSHAVIYDAQRDSIIEAVGEGVHEVPLAKFVGRVHQLVVIRPSGLTAADGLDVVARARSAIGAAYDYTGLFGVDDPKKWYCSELVAWAIFARERGLPLERVVIPSHLVRYGEVVFDSGPREQANEVQ